MNDGLEEEEEDFANSDVELDDDDLFDAEEEKTAPKKKKKAAVRKAKATSTPDGEFVLAADDEEMDDLEEEAGRERLRSHLSQLDGDFGRAPRRDSAGSEGIIQKIVLTNFMCHKHLKIEMGPQINFVTGANGSGKSAILVGLALCLGASTGFIQRSGTLAGFVREGCASGTVAVTLSNDGADAFKPELYGRSITIERSISRSTGASKYKLKNASGGLVTQDRSELVPMCDRFNIQVNNPCIIMMQETSRDFLGNSPAKKKYELFERATQIRPVMDHLVEMMDEITNAMHTRDRKKALLPALEHQFEIAKKEHDEIEHLKHVKEQMRSVKAELVWAHVVEREKIVSEAEATLEKDTGTLQRNTETIEGAAEKLAVKVKVEEDLSERLRGVGEENDAAGLTLVKAREALQEATSKSSKAAKEVRGFPVKISRLAGRIKELERQNQLAKAKAAKDRGEEDRLRFEKVTEEHKKLAVAQTKLEEAKSSHNQSLLELEDARAARQQAGPALHTICREVDRAQSSFQGLDRAQKDPVALWGQQMPDICRLIKKNASSFSRPPIGPIGAHVKLDNAKAFANGKPVNGAEAVEHLLSKVLSSFWCATYDDSRKLQRLCEQSRINGLRVIVQDFHDKRYSGIRIPDESKDYVRVMDLISCEPAGLWNVLIDQVGPEGSVIVHDSDFRDASSLLDRRDVVRVLSMDSSAKTKTRRGDIRQQTAPRKFNFYRLRPAENREEQKRLLEQSLNEAKERRSVAEKAKADADRRFMRLEADLKEYNAAMYRAQDEERIIRGHIQDLERKAGVGGDENEDGLEGKITELSLSLEQYRSDEMDAKSRHMEAEKAMGLLKQNVDDAERIVDDLYARHGAVEDQARDARQKVSKMRSNMEKARKQISLFVTRVEGLKEALERHREFLATGMEQARGAFPERVEVSKPVAELEAMVGGMEKALQKQQQDKGKSVEEVEQEYLVASRKLKKVQNRLAWLSDMLHKLSRALSRRQKKIDRIRNHVGVEVSTWFNTYLTKKGYEGQLQFIHETGEQALNISVTLDPANSSQASQSDVQTLSGGESSFSTVALMLSFWEVIDTPFRIMDEFDIYQDAAHRKLSIQTLVEFGRTVPHRQFIFLSPLDTDDIPKAHDVIAHRLEPPERGQGDIRRFGAENH